MAINQLQPMPATVAGISQALDALGSVYKMKQASSAKELMDQEIARNQAQAQLLGEQRDLGSGVSQRAQAGRSALLNTLMEKKILSQNSGKSLLDMIPKSSAYELNNDQTMSPLMEIAKSQLAGEAAMARNHPRDVANQSSANSQYSQEIKPFEDTITAANRVHHIISQIKAGKLKSTPTLGNDLSSAVAQTFNSGKAATVYGQEHNTLSSMEGSAAERYGWAAGKAMNTVAPEQLDQLDKDMMSLREQYAQSHANYFNSWVQGIDPSLQGGLQKRFQSFRKSTVNPQQDEPAPSAPPNESAQGGGFHISTDAIAAEKARRAALKNQAQVPNGPGTRSQ